MVVALENIYFVNAFVILSYINSIHLHFFYTFSEFNRLFTLFRVQIWCFYGFYKSFLTSPFCSCSNLCFSEMGWYCFVIWMFKIHFFLIHMKVFRPLYSVVAVNLKFQYFMKFTSVYIWFAIRCIIILWEIIILFKKDNNGNSIQNPQSEDCCLLTVGVILNYRRLFLIYYREFFLLIKYHIALYKLVLHQIWILY